MIEVENMNFARRMIAKLAEHRRQKPPVHWRVSNLTRQTILVECVEMADSGATRRKGLLGRDGLAPGEGLWIVPCESVHTIGMRFPIDLVYLDRKKRVRKVRSKVMPWRLSACLSAHSVIELAAGAALVSKTQRDDQLEFSSVGTIAGLTQE